MTTRRLLLIRHAKAESQGEVDLERRLAARGRADAAAIGRWLAEHDLIPDRVVVSPATRARQTWQLTAESVGVTVEPTVDERVYHNTVEDLLEVIAQAPADIRTLAIVGHNPSIEDMAAAIDDGTGDSGARREMTQKYPTSGIAVFAVGPDWAELDSRTATLIRFAAPRG